MALRLYWNHIVLNLLLNRLWGVAWLMIAMASLAAGAERPNVVLIMVDDLGFSDLGFHGGEIATPNLDALAAGGVRFSQFYNTGRCCPTRASLMTGLHPHQTGIGHMTNPPGQTVHDLGVPGYRGFINDQCVTIAEVLRAAGYATLMTGKWHLGFDQRECWPLQRGFDRYYGCIAGATRYFQPVQPRGMMLDNTPLEQPEGTTDEAFYTTDAFTDYAIRFLAEHQVGERQEDPFFLYLAYTAPHWPLQAFEDDIAKYRGRYADGWEQLRQRRYKRQIELGLIDPAWPLSPPSPGIASWESLDEAKRDEMDLKMAVFAAMVDRVDQNIGKLVKHLKESGQFENTLILFLSDNGACQEGGVLGRGEFHDVQRRNLENDNSYGEAWANAGSTPFRLYKHFLHEGGSATPFVMHWPARIRPRQDWYSSPAQLIDVLPTLIDLAGAVYPQTRGDQSVPPLEGVSLRPALDGLPLERSRPLFLEHENNAAIRDGDWKLVGRNVALREGVDASKWELYNLREDRTELNNLATAMPDKVRELADQWNAWAQRVGVYPKGEDRQAKAPAVAGRELTITARIRHQRPHGVVLAHGGVRFGYSLHFVDGRPAFSVRNRGKLTELVAEQAIRGPVELRAVLTEKTMSISVDGALVAEQPSPGLLAEQPIIGLSTGSDAGDPVGNYPRTNRFNGRVLSADVLATEPAAPPLPAAQPETGGEQPASDGPQVADPQAGLRSAPKPSDPPNVKAERPNVLLLLVDDLKPVLGCYGDTHAQTPHIDRLAARAMRFEWAYCNQAICAPSRFNLMLGSHSTSTGLYGLGSPLRQVLPDAVTLPQHFAVHGGYRTESIGKVFHIGHGNRGDQQSFVVEPYVDQVIEYNDPSSTGGELTREEALFTNQQLGRIGQLPRGAAFESPDVADEAYADGRVARETIRRLQAAKQRRESEQTPFFIACGFVRPHLPFSVPKRYWDRYDPQTLPLPEFEAAPNGAPAVAVKRGGEIVAYKPVPERGELPEELKRRLIHGYYASTSFVDAQIGKVLDELERLQLSDSTIVVLWGDHGYHLGDLGIWTKHTNYEQANRIPLLIAAPGVTRPGTVTEQIAETVDLYPTLAELAGLPSPTGPQPIDGKSLVPVLQDPAQRIRDHAYHAFPRGRKLGRAIRTERYRLVQWEGEGQSDIELELYDYQTDPLERQNLATQQPQIVEQLQRILACYPKPAVPN